MVLSRAAASADLWEGEMRGVVIDGKKVLLVRIGGQVRAYEDRCAHLGVALSEGSLEGAVLTCRAHQYEYDVRSGAGVNPRSVKLRAYPVEERDGDILVEVTP